MSKIQSDIILEAIEVFINQILYLRDAFPQQIFKKRRIYNAPVYASDFPQLNTYVQNVLKSVKALEMELQRLELQFYLDESGGIIERHIFDISNPTQSECCIEDEYLLDFEEQLRKSLYEMPERMKLLEKLPSEAKMKIQLHTTQIGHVKLNSNAYLQEFPWMRAEEPNTNPTKQLYILPLTEVPHIGLSIMTEV